MKAILFPLLLVAATTQASKEKQCPGSPAAIHAKCLMKVNFASTPCSDVMEEAKLRAGQQEGWLDPHNRGTYEVLATTDNQLSLSRKTGDEKYTDLMDLTFESATNDSGDEGCILHACSESQVFSVLDFSTNYCSLRNLYCSSQDDCPVAVHDHVAYEEEYTSCMQHDVTRCLSSLSDK